MKTKHIFPSVIFILVSAWMVSCTPVKMTTWVSPGQNKAVSKILVWGMFDRTDYAQPFEHTVAGYLEKKGITAVEAGSVRCLTAGERYF